jgi:hypothetical protein
MRHAPSVFRQKKPDAFLGRPTRYPVGIKCACGWYYAYAEDFLDALRRLGPEKGGAELKRHMERVWAHHGKEIAK